MGSRWPIRIELLLVERRAVALVLSELILRVLLIEHGACEAHRRSWNLPGVLRADNDSFAGAELAADLAAQLAQMDDDEQMYADIGAGDP